MPKVTLKMTQLVEISAQIDLEVKNVKANSDLTYCQDPDDGSWADYVEDIYVGFVTHQAKPSAGGYSLHSTLDNARS
jgi:hypothetical protein